MTPRAWPDGWVGIPWIDGEYDCTDFVCEVQARQFGRVLRLPGRARTVRGRDRQIRELARSFARPLGIGEGPRDGDGVLMRAAGRRGLGHHIGLWAGPEEAPRVLHCLRGAGSVLHPLRDLSRRGLETAGTYRWL